MPCYDDRDHENRVEYRREPADVRRIAFLESALCAVIKTLGSADPFHQVDFVDAGISRGQLERWWKGHQVRDAENRRNLVQGEARKKIRAAALAKLTIGERRALGIK